jgi:CheY-like chemotaxis protein
LDQLDQITVRATDLTGQLLTFCRRQPLTIQDLELNVLIEQTFRILRSVLGQKIYLDFDFAKEGLWVRGDQSQIELVLFNLCINARDAMPFGGTLVISTETERIADGDPRRLSWAQFDLYSTISVTDTGAGMDRETLSRVFEPFFTTKAPDKGTGLGLSTAYGIVEQHQGSIEVSSTHGKGSTFKVYLPALEVSSQAGREIKSIFLMVSDRVVRLATRRLLERSGYTVHDVGSEAAAFAMIDDVASRLFAAVIEEVPSGPAVLRRLRRHQPDLPVLVSCWRNGEPAAEHQGTELISSPIRGQEMLETLRRLEEAEE